MIVLSDRKRILRPDGKKFDTLYKGICDRCGSDRTYVPKSNAHKLCKPCAMKLSHAETSDETRARMSKAKIGKTPWNAGKTGVFSDETRTKMSIRKKGLVPWNKHPNGALISDLRKIKCRVRHYLRRAAIKGLISYDFKDYLQCDVDTLKKHIESLFRQGMTWNNYGEWHLDHCVPLHCFNLLDDQELKKACHYQNVQPLWASENLSKQNKRSALILAGASGSGKSWVCSKLKDTYNIYDFNNKMLLNVVSDYRPIYAITVGVSTFIKNHPDIDFKLIVINESEKVIKERLISRGATSTDGILRRIKRMQALSANAVFSGTSEEVLNYLNTVAHF